MTRLWIAVVVVLSMLPARAEITLQSVARDTTIDVRPLNSWQRFNQKVDKFTSTKGFQMTYVGVPLVVAGVLPYRDASVSASCVTTMYPSSNTSMTTTCNMLRPW